MKNPYEVLGIGRDADEKSVKDAYRQLARKFHPDVNPGNKEAEERFKDIQVAYDLLADPEKRAAYDRLGDRAFAGAGGMGFDPGSYRSGSMPSFEEIFGPGSLQSILASLFGGGFTGAAPPQPRGDVEAEVPVTFEEAYRGTEKRFVLDGQPPIRVRIPAGVEDGALLRVPRGNKSAGRPGGELYLRVRVATDPRFEREGSDLFLDLPLAIAEAALGAEIAVPTPDGDTRVRIPPGTASGRLLRLAGRGLPRPEGGKGDLFARIRIVPPPEPSPEEQRVLTELSRVSSFNPRKRS